MGKRVEERKGSVGADRLGIDLERSFQVTLGLGEFA
jgi:hypothetical protein